MRQQVLQNSLITGVIAPTLFGRVDLEKYYNAVSVAENVVISPHGGMKRRDGLRHLVEVPSESRLFSFEFSVTQHYVFVIAKDHIYIYEPAKSTLLATLDWKKAISLDTLNDMDIIQSADTVILVHEDMHPKRIQRQGSHSTWAFDELTFTHIPKYKFDGKTEEDVWSDKRGYPKTCTFHQGRLCFGGSKSKPTSVWCSVVNDFFNFDTGGTTTKADNAIFDVLDTDQFNSIKNIVSAKTLQVLTVGGEFTNSAEILTPSSSAWVRNTGYGSSRLKPVVLDGATYFMDRFRKTVRSFIYDWNEGGYTTPPISILAEHIINDVVDLDIVRGSSISVSNLLYLVNNDGTVAVLNTMRKENISGWTMWKTHGKFRKVTVTTDTVTFIVERDGKHYLEVLDPDVLLDHSFSAVNTDEITVDDYLDSTDIRIVADGVTQKNTKAVNKVIKADRVGKNIYTGVNYEVIIKTLPISANTQAGNFVNHTRRITRAIVNLYQSRGVYVNDHLITRRKFGNNVLDKTLEPITGVESVYLLGYNNRQIVTIKQTNPEPLTLLSLDLEISY